ncbi:tlde1 domain-containing protein, partial [Enterobacter hormaechei]
MTLHGKFIINDADYSPLAFDGIGVFMAFSGNGAYRNKGACGIIPNVGPLPKGKYY